MYVLFSMEFLEDALKRAEYKAAQTVYEYSKAQNEKDKQKAAYKEALELAKERGLNTALYDDCLSNWAKVQEDIEKIRQEIDIEKTADVETAAKLRYLEKCLQWPIVFGGILNTILYSQHWLYSRPPKDKELLPVRLDWEAPSIQADYRERWLEENFIAATSSRLIRAVVYEEDKAHEYNFQDLPFGKLVDKIQELSMRWGEAARATGFDFNKPLGGDNLNTEDAEKLLAYLDERIEFAYNAAPEELRAEYEKSIRQLVKEVWKYHQKKLNPPQISTKTNLPDQLVFPIDKVTQTAFSGKANGQTTPIRSERLGSKKEITTLLSINFDDLGKDVIVNGKKELAPSDREVHNAIVTLCECGNEYITAQAIYRTLAGDKKARISEKHRNEIYESITKCMFTQVDLDDSEDAKAYGYNALKYRGPLLAAEFVVGVELNGQTVDGIRIFRRPILFEYASKKNQIGRIDTKLLATPLNKTSEVLVLQGYLHRRISAMKSSKLPKKILYSSIFEQIGDLEEREQKDKKTKMRTAVRKILDYWKEQNFIVDYKEEKRGVLYHGINIFLPPKEA